MNSDSKWDARVNSAIGFVIGVVVIVTALSVRWTKGVVVGDSCASTEEDYVCMVELVPDGTYVTADSESNIATGTHVKLRVWHSILTDFDTYKVVR